ncbi:MAG: CAP domain-containing protein [Proteobacteria bacterium]|jgi:uncharacterized protein YkwD|nr:CAP domain-containing protein [Pseudomonadota bacterium]
MRLNLLFAFVVVLCVCSVAEARGRGRRQQSYNAPTTAQTTEVEAITNYPTAADKVVVVDGVKLAEIEANIIKFTNEERARYGLPPFEVDKDLMQTARGHAAWMTRNQAMVHTRLPLAENIAMGQPHSSDVVNCWMNSSGHRANILNPGHLRIGVAAFRTASGVIFWCQQFRNR